jgi:hypothetical protein
MMSARPATAPTGKPPPYDLAVGCEVRNDIEVLLRAAEPVAKARHDLVQDHDDAVLVGKFAHRFEEPRQGRDDPLDGLDNDGRDVLAMLCEQRGEGVLLVERRNQHQLGHWLGNAGGVRDRGREVGGLLRRRAELRVVVNPVIGAFELENLGAPGEGPRQANRVES